MSEHCSAQLSAGLACLCAAGAKRDQRTSSGSGRANSSLRQASGSFKILGCATDHLFISPPGSLSSEWFRQLGQRFHERRAAELRTHGTKQPMAFGF